MTSDEPAYLRVLTELRNLIVRGELTGGQQLPSVREIADRYGVSTATAGRVIAELASGGLVITRHGAGAYVREFKAIRRSSPRRLSFDQWGLGQQIQDADTPDRTRTVDIEVGELAAPEWVAGPLGLKTDDPVVFRSRRFVVDDRSVQLATSYIPTDLARGTAIMHTDTGPGGMYARLAETGHAPDHFVEYLRARMPLPDETRRLDLPTGTPVIEVTRHAFEDSGRCLEVNRMVLDGMAYLLDYSFPA